MSDDDPKPKRRGRPPAPEDKRRRHNLTFRIRSDLRQQIEASAQKNGRSMSEEIELLIERSLWHKSDQSGFVEFTAENIESAPRIEYYKLIKFLKDFRSQREKKSTELILDRISDIENMLKNVTSADIKTLTFHNGKKEDN